MKKDKMHYGWVVLGAITVLLGFVWGMEFNANSIFVPGLEKALNATRQQMLIGVSLKGVAMTITSYFSGKLLTRYKLLNIARLATTGLVLCYLLRAVMTSIYHYYALMTVATVCTVLSGFIPMSIVVNNWFLTHRGKMLGIAFTGSGVGGMVFNYIGGILIANTGIRTTYLIFAAIGASITFLTVFVLIRERPQDMGLKPYGYDQDNGDYETDELDSPVGIPYGDAMKSYKMWIFLIATVVMGMGMQGLVNNIVPHLNDMGYPITLSSKVASISMIALAGSKILLGGVIDRFGVKLGVYMANWFLIIGYIGMYFARQEIFFVAIIAGVGIGCCYASISLPTYADVIYGPRDFAKISAVFQTASGIGGILIPLLLGELYRRAGDYLEAFKVMLSLLVIALILQFISMYKIKSYRGDEVYGRGN